MTSQTFVLLSGAISFGVPIAVAVYELLMLSPHPRGGDEPPREEHFPPAPKPLPDCLLPRSGPVPSPLRVRILEDA